MKIQYHNPNVSRVLTAATMLAFWIKFNIVLFTYKPYTATKFFFPLFFLIIGYYVIRNFDKKLVTDIRVLLLAAVALTFLIPVGYLSHPHNWRLYIEKSLSIISFFSLYFAVILLDDNGKKKLFAGVYIFCLIALAYFAIQFFFGLTYEQGHFRIEQFIPHRPFGILDDPDHSAGVYIVGFFLTIALGFYKKRFFLLYPIAIFFAFAIIKSQSAGAAFGILGGSLVFIIGICFVFIQRISVKKIFLLMWFIWLSLFAAMFIFYWVYTNNLFGVAELIQKFKSNTTVVTRLYLMIFAKDVFLHNPIFGVGFANDFNPAVFELYKSPYMVFETHYHIHTSYLSALATTGLVGFFSLFSLATLSIWQYAKVFSLQKTKIEKVQILSYFSLFIGIQTLSYSLQHLFSISFWFSFVLPFLLFRIKKDNE